MKAVTIGPKFLSFERTYALEWEPCPRCAGSGGYGHSVPRYGSVCFNCRGLGRRITRAGRDLFKEICRELGRPVLERESRIDPKHLDQVYGRELKVGMCVGALYPVKKPRKVITALEWLQLGQVRVTFEGESQAVFSAMDSLSRELTHVEIDRVQRLMAMRIDVGAISL